MSADCHCRSHRCSQCETAISGKVTDIQHGIAEKQGKNCQRTDQAKLQCGLSKREYSRNSHDDFLQFMFILLHSMNSNRKYLLLFILIQIIFCQNPHPTTISLFNRYNGFHKLRTYSEFIQNAVRISLSFLYIIKALCCNDLIYLCA